MERIYGVRNGSTNAPNTVVGEKNSFTQSDIAQKMNVDVRTLQNYKLLSDMIPELEELLDTGIVTKTTALAIIKNLTVDEQEQLIATLDTTKKITQNAVQKYIDRIKILETNNQEVQRLQNDMLNLQTEKDILERRLKLSQEETDKYDKLKSDIEFLTKQKFDLGRQINSSTELAGLTVRLQKMLEEELAPIKFKRCMETLESSSVSVQNITEIIMLIDSWSDEMKKLLSNTCDYVVDTQ